MKAAVIHAPKDLRIEDRALTEPGPGEVRLKGAFGGICGSDIHYYLHGGSGIIRLREPMILGHEVSAVVDAVGAGVADLAPGDKVAVNPSSPCHVCDQCVGGAPNRCRTRVFCGSAMPMPHIQGLFSQNFVVKADRAIKLPADARLETAAFAEPFAVAVHAVRQAGPIMGRTVLVIGAGPIGLLTAMAARLAGAARIVVSDIQDATLATARTIGVDAAVNVGTDPDGLAKALPKGCDVAIEASGAPVAIGSAFSVLNQGGTLVQVANGPEAPFKPQLLSVMEYRMVGSFRFTDDDFALSASVIADGRVDPTPLLSEILPLDRAEEALQLATDRTRAMKVQIALS